MQYFEAFRLIRKSFNNATHAMQIKMA